MKRGAYFFVLDAFIAGIIIISSLVIVLGTVSIEESSTQNYVLAEDFVFFLENTRVSDYGGEQVFNLTEQGVITDTALTLLEQLVLFYEEFPEREEDAEDILEEIARLAPANNGISFSVTDAIGETEFLYNRTDVNIASARTQLSAQRIVVARGQASISPYIFEVRLWR